MAIDPIPAPCFPEAPFCNLSGPMPEDADVLSVQLSPDGGRVVYTADRDQDQVAELFSVPVLRGARQRLNVPAGGSGGGVISIAVSPDGARVLYRFIRVQGQPAALFSVPIRGPGSASVLLAEDVAQLSDPPQQGFRVSADSQVVVYLTPDGRQLRAVPIAGPAGASIPLTRPFVPDGRLSSFEIAPDSRRVFYLAGQDSAAIEGLYRVGLRPPDPSNPPTTRLSAADVAAVRFLLSPTDRAVLYQGASEADGPSLYRVGFSGSVSRKRSHDLPPDFRISQRDWTVTPSGHRLVYRVIEPLPGGQLRFQLHSAPTTGPRGNVRLDRPQAEPSPSVQVSADGNRVVYWSPAGLFSVPVDGPAGATVRLNPQPSAAGVSTFFAISPNSRRVVYEVEAEDGPIDLFSVPIGGPADASVKLNQSEKAGLPFLVDATSTRVVYRGTPDDIRKDLYSVPIDAVGRRSRPTAGIDRCTVFILLLTPDGQRAVYTAEQGGQLVRPAELYSSPLNVQVADPGEG
jgi:dipeptidyl aminopeptidase/acylaminoacyl peptidase